jgi:hypothetical protein
MADEPPAKRLCLLPVAQPCVRPRAIAKPRPPRACVALEVDLEAEAQHLEELRQERHVARLWVWHRAATTAEERCFRLSLAGLSPSSDPVTVGGGHPDPSEPWEPWSWVPAAPAFYPPPSWWGSSS